MSLLRDTDFLIHRLRLAYLRNVEDHYGPRVISLDPAYNNNSYIVRSSLADPERWPELTLPSSPNLSEEEEEKVPELSRKARLRHSRSLDSHAYTPGSASGRTSNKTLTDSTPKPTPDVTAPPEDEMQNFISGNAPVQEALSTATSPVKAPPPQLRMGSWIDLDKDGDEAESPAGPKVNVQEPSAPAEVPVAKVVQFIPKFKGAAEMEARRRVRMAARRGPQAPAPQPGKPITVDTSSSEDATEDSSSDEFEHIGIAVADVVDEFDPDFAATRTSASTSGFTSNVSIDASSVSHSPLPPQSPLANKGFKTAERPHPTANNAARPRHHRHTSHGAAKADDTLHSKRGDGSPTTRRRFDSNSSNGMPEGITFTKKKIAVRPVVRSALSAKLAGSTSANPFAELYSTISGRGSGAAARTVQVYFPHAEQPRHKPLVLNVRADATIEEVIGFALWSFWEERWLPKLDDGLSGESDPRWKARLSTVGWVLRMAEDDGEVDDDCPAPDRGKKAKEFMDMYAILEATPTQVQQNQFFESQLQRNATPKKVDKLDISSASLMPTMSSVNQASISGIGSMLSASPGLSSSHGPQVLLRVHTADAVQILTTIKVFSGTYMQEALELVCRRQRIEDPSDYALLLADKSLVVPLDRTVASLQGKRELSLVRRSTLPQLGLKNVGTTTDPNASIFAKPKRLSENNDQELSKVDFTAAYKKYTIYRKIPMLVTRQERTLAIDGDYIHIMPSANKARAVFDNGKTASYHVTTIANCSQSSKNSALFKLILNRAGANPPKRYDFEAENPKLAADIVASIRNLKSLDRTWSVHKARRSRHIA